MFCFVEKELHCVAKVGFQQAIPLPQPMWPVSTTPSSQCQSRHPGLPACRGRTLPAELHPRPFLSLLPQLRGSADILPLRTAWALLPALSGPGMDCEKWKSQVSYSLSSQLLPHNHTLSLAAQTSCKPDSLEACLCILEDYRKGVRADHLPLG